MKVPYFVAKYVEDPIRMEPKNIGVLAVLDDHIHARFLGEDDGSMDLRKVRSYVRHTAAYKQWIDYWRYVIANQPSSKDALRELTDSSRSNYLISEAATLMVDEEEGVNQDWVMDYLFHLLVSSFPEPKNEELSLAQRCDEIISQYASILGRYLAHQPDEQHSFR